MKGWTAQAVQQLTLVDAAGAPEPTIVRSNWRNTGKEFEKEMERTFGAYQSAGLATVRKVDPPVRVLWIDDKERPGKKRQHVIFQANPWLDYAGAWTARHGRALFVECKSTSSHRLPMRAGHLSDDQIDALRCWRHAGAAACVLWQFAGRVAVLTPEVVVGAKDRREKSLVFEGLPQAPRGNGLVIWDFLPVLESLLWPTPAANKLAEHCE